MKKISKKGKVGLIWLLLVSAVLALVIGVGILLYNMYVSSPIPTAISLGQAVEERDSDAVFEKIEPSDSNKLKVFMTLFGYTRSDVFDMIFPEDESHKIKSFNLKSYSEWNGGATVGVTLVYDNQSKKDITLYFVKINDRWFLSVDELIPGML